VSFKDIRARIASLEEVGHLQKWATAGAAGDRIAVKGAVGSLPAFLLSQLPADQRTIVCLVPTPETAAYLTSDLEQILGPDLVVPFPPTGQKPFDPEQVKDPGPILQRGDVLRQVRDGNPGFVVASVDAVVERVPEPDLLDERTIVISTGSVQPPDDLAALLLDHGFTIVEFVEEPGEFARRGGILDVYPYAGEYPLRVEYFGDEIESIREFDPRSQRSVSRMATARIVPNIDIRAHADARLDSLFGFLPENTLLVLFDEAEAMQRFDALFEEASSAYSRTEAQGFASPDTVYMRAADATNSIARFPVLHFGGLGQRQGKAIAVESKPQPSFNANLFLLREQLDAISRKNGVTYILCDARAQEVRLRELLELETDTRHTQLLVESIHHGFELPQIGLYVYTDHQIFNRYHRPTTRRRRRKSGGMTLREIKGLAPGDFVVHIDYGIGKFAGMEAIEVRGKTQEAVRVLFQGDDMLYVSIGALHKLHKYSGKEGHQPRLTKLGSGQWEKAKARTKKRVKDIARDLINLYARRKASPGYAFSNDTIWQRELEASFEFEDTPDQALAAEAVKADMREGTPMDRLVCGDVGFGKTEVAIRAAFKAAQDGKQVAVLVPTTILAAQHYETFSRRLKQFPVRIEVLSRFRSAKEQKETAERAARGEIDILIGTHRIAAKDVKFKNLGLLIIDEEQRFGVSVKERLRNLRAEVDTLTLTATPIPRTLQFSLLGARDLSIINTPPPNRQPIVTEIHTFDKNLIRDAILHETSRGGQVFFIHNRVQSIEEMASNIRMLIPEIRTRVAHGQMKPAELEDVMFEFMERKFDVLVSTNIIESGLDISNANTIIINHAERFGLSELHQLRGRVGRSDRKAFCYLLVPSIHALTREAKQRLQAVEEFSDLGSGFNIAMRDLDIRGAGNMLGAEQTGFIEEVGFETYHQILDEAVQELRQDEFADLFKEKAVPRAAETVVDVEENALIPESYLANNVERLNIYRRIAEVNTTDELEEIRTEMVDRFGPPPAEVGNLFVAAEMKILGHLLRLPKVTYKNQRLFLEMPAEKDDPFFYAERFQNLLASLSRLSNRYVLKESTSKKLRAIIQTVEDLQSAREVLAIVSSDVRAAAA
jgi:transcription-repair coupling factor (superfamily II helicase)